jgi:hypothetical protein
MNMQFCERKKGVTDAGKDECVRRYACWIQKHGFFLNNQPDAPIIQTILIIQ